MTENIFDRFDLGDLVKHTNWGGIKDGKRNALITYGVVSAIRTHETPILPERKIEVTIQYANSYMSRVHYNNHNTGALTKLEIIAKGKNNDSQKK
jgi:hypothetical protein